MHVTSSNMLDTWVSEEAAPHDRLTDKRLLLRVFPTSIAVWPVAFYIALFIVRPWERLMPSLADHHFERWYALGMICVVVASLGLRGIRIWFDAQSLSVYFFFAAVGLSALCAWNPELSWHGDGGGLYAYVTVVVMYFLLVTVIRTPYELVFMVACYIVAMWVYLAKNLWEYFLHGAGQYADGMIRLQGVDTTYGHPNDLAVSIVVSLPMTVFLLTSRKAFCATWPTICRLIYTYGLLSYFLLTLVSIVFTYSRTGMVAVVAFIGLLTIRGQRLRPKIVRCLAGLAVVVVVWQVMPEDIRRRAESIWNPDAARATYHVSAMDRVAGFHAGIEMFKSFPLTGVGVGNFITYRKTYLDGIGLASHNLYGQVLGQTGLIGGVMFASLVLCVFLNARRLRRIRPLYHDDEVSACYSDFGLAVRDTTLMLLFTGLFSHTLYRFNWLWLAAFAVLAVKQVTTMPRDLEGSENFELIGR